MKKLFFFILSIISTGIIPNISIAQCISGNCANGSGEKIYTDKSRFVGTFEEGAKKTGTYYYPNGDIYKGSFENNQRTGFAQYSYKNGEQFTGNYLNDQKEFGKFIFINGEVYTGTLKNNKPDGFGTLVFPNGKEWEGNWEGGRRTWGIDIGTDSLVESIQNPSKTNEPRGSKDISKIVAPRIYAVIVGISDYEGIYSDLNYCDDDAKLFYNHLKQALPNEMTGGKTILLLDKNATCQNISVALQQVFSQSTENDFIIFYFSGHGSPGNFCPTDYSNQLLSHEVVKNYFKKSKARYRLCVADACFSGSIGSTINTYSIPAATSQLNDARLAVIMSSRTNQTSAENPELQQGVFSYYFISGLKGKADLNHDNYVTMGELFVYTKQAVEKKSNSKQVPVIYGKNLDKIPLTKIKR
ncbi:MAG: caspase family protein [Prolixibacteraceae bacterium]|nr:caspase family protein [Prolixibacteraceae bacterium]